MFSVVSMCGRCLILATTPPSWSLHSGRSCRGVSVPLCTPSGLESLIFWKVDIVFLLFKSRAYAMQRWQDSNTSSLLSLHVAYKRRQSVEIHQLQARPRLPETLDQPPCEYWFSFVPQQKQKASLFQSECRREHLLGYILRHVSFVTSIWPFVSGLRILAVGWNRPDRLQLLPQAFRAALPWATQQHWCCVHVD